MGPKTTQKTKTAVAKAPQLFNIKRVGSAGNTADRVLAGTLKDYLVDSEELSLSDNVNYPVMDIKKDQPVTLRIDYIDSDEYGLLWFSRPLSAKLRNKSIKIADMLDYPIQEQPIFMDLENKEPFLDEDGNQVIKYIISVPTGGSRVKIKTPVAGEKKATATVSDVW